MERLSRIIIVTLSILVMPTTAVPILYEITDLGTMGGSVSGADAINDNGQVVGEGFYYDGTSFHDTYTWKGYPAEVASLNNHGHLTGAVGQYIFGEWR
jgi:hypothetical protein